MARAASEPKPVRLYGPPRALRPRELIEDVSGHGHVRLPASLCASGADRIEFADARRLRVRLLRHTPPGEYAAELEVGDKSVAVALNVEPYESLKSTPAALAFAGSPGRACDTVMKLENRGNVASEIPESCGYWLFERQGLEHAFIDTFHEKTEDPQELLGTLLKRLRGATGGRSTCRITSGAGALEPGAQRTIGLRAFLPKQLTPGRSYVGLMTLGPMYQGITVHVTKNERGSKK